MSKQAPKSRFYELRDLAFCDKVSAARLIAADKSVLEARSGIGETALHFLVVENDLSSVEFLRSQGAKIATQNDFGDTPLLDAAGLGYLDMCRYLVGHGADFRHLSPKRGGSAFSQAASSNEVEVLSYLLGLLSPDEDLNPFFTDVEAELALDGESSSATLLEQRGLRRRWTAKKD